MEGADPAIFFQKKKTLTSMEENSRRKTVEHAKAQMLSTQYAAIDAMSLMWGKQVKHSVFGYLGTEHQSTG
jgi:hypothetical protein